MLSNCTKITSKNNLINKYYSVLIYDIQKQNKITSDVELIQKAVNEALSNIIVDEKVCYIKTLFNMIHNLIPHEKIICDDKDSPWINKDI